MRRDATAAGPAGEHGHDHRGRQAYQHLLAGSPAPGTGTSMPGPRGYWTVGPTRYQRDGDGGLVARHGAQPGLGLVDSRCPARTGRRWTTPATAYRTVREHETTNLTRRQRPGPGAACRRGRSTRPRSPASIRCPRCRWARTSRPRPPRQTRPAGSALGGADLQPSLNLGGYVSQPVQLITTLAALPALENSAVFSGDLHAGDPISVIRVRVAGVTGPEPGVPGTDQGGRPADRGAHPSDRGHRHRIVARAHRHHTAQPAGSGSPP